MHILVVSAAVALASCTGCRDRTSKPAPSATGVVVVVTDATEVEAARKKWADDREQALVRLLAHPGAVVSYETESVEIVRSQRPRALEAFCRIRDGATEPADRRVQAVVAMATLDVAPDAELLARLAADPAGEKELLGSLRELHPPKKGPPPPAVRRVVVRAVDSPDAAISSRAAQEAGYYRLTEAANAVVRRASGDRGADVAFLRAAAELRPTGEVLDVLLRRVRAADKNAAYHVVEAVTVLAKNSGDAAVRGRAADGCFQYLKALPDERRSIGGDALSALDAVETAPPPETGKRMLTDLVRTAPHHLVRAYALVHLDKLDAAYAAKLSSETGVPFAEPPRDPAARKGLTPAQAAAACVRHRVMSESEANAALAALSTPTTAQATPDDEDRSEHGVREFLYFAKRFVTFDVETGTSPNRHDQLILEFAAAAAGRFTPEAVLETFVPDEPDGDAGKYTVQFISGGRLYRFNPRDLGDWYDVEAVLAALNRALEDAHVGERFVPLEPNGQVAEIVFADPAALAAAAPELGLKVSTDPDDARKQGRAYEEGVVGRLKNE